MATAAAAALLDELMGRARNSLPNDRSNLLSWNSPDVCRHFLVKFCPHELFTNTKSDLGPCEKIHDEELKKEFEESNSYLRTAYEDDFVRYAEFMLVDVNKRIQKGKQRLALSVREAVAGISTGDPQVDEQIVLLSEKITGLVSEAERLGSEGNVEEAQGLLKLCDQLREERDTLRRSTGETVWQMAAEMAASQEKQMEVCDVCGAFLIVGDAQQRIDDHLTGKQHMGFAKLRNAIKDIRDNREKNKLERDSKRGERSQSEKSDEHKRDRGGGERDRGSGGRGGSERDDRRRVDDKRRRSSDRGSDGRRDRYDRSRGGDDRSRGGDDRHRSQDYRGGRGRDYNDRGDRDRRRSRSRDRGGDRRDRDRHQRSRSRDREKPRPSRADNDEAKQEN